MKTIKLAHIRIDGGTQVRRATDQEMVMDYCEAMEGGAKFPAIIVFHDGTDYWCADGFHRIMAANRCGFISFECDVRKGTADDAAWFALGANKAHGKRLNRSDVRNAIAMALRKFGGKSNRQIAEQIGCSDHTVEHERKAQESTAQIAQLTSRIGADGRSRPAKREAVDHWEKAETTEHKQKDESSPNTGATEARINSTAMQHVSEAIAAMRKIKANDPARAHAFAHLRKWVRDNE
jgi:transposase